MSEENTLYVDIISPERPVYSGQALSVTAKAWDGEVGILPGHAPMVTKLGIGEVRVTRGTLADKVVDRFVIKQGYLEVSHNKVVVLSEDAQAIADHGSDEQLARYVDSLNVVRRLSWLFEFGG